MKAKSYKLKYTPTEEQLIKNLSARSGGSWINKNSKLYISKFFELSEYNFEFIPYGGQNFIGYSFFFF